MGKPQLLSKIVRRGATCGAVIVAAGTASRMKGTDKILADLCGAPVLLHTLRAFQTCDDISDIVVVTRQDLLETVSELCVGRGITKTVKVVRGGDTRADSVLCGLDALPKRCDYVAIHDGARPLVSVKLIHETVCKASKYGAAAPGLPVKDTVKVVRGGVVESTPDRATLYAVQTPQVFKRSAIRGALEQALQAKTPVTDDCSAAEAMGMNVVIVQGEEENVKITTPADLTVAAALLGGRKPE